MLQIMLFVSALYISICVNSHFPGAPGLTDTRISLFWILLELRMMEMVVTSGAISRAKLQSKCHHQETNTQLFLQARCLFCHPINSIKALKEKFSVIAIIKNSHLP